MNGYAGKILKINLTTQEIEILNTSDYEEWGGGHGIGSKIFWDLVGDKTISGFDPENVVTFMTSPLAGTMVPGAGSRTEVQGIGVQTYPEWFTRSNFGGRFAAMLKYAGWDGIAVQGQANNPVWIDIRNDNVQIRDAQALWGKDTWETQKQIWEEVTGTKTLDGWTEIISENAGSRTTQWPAVVAIGPAGEVKARIATLTHDSGHGAGQGGFGGVLGAKQLKAISVIGTGSIGVADPKALFDARLWAQREYGNDLYNPEETFGSSTFWSWFGVDGHDQIGWPKGGNARLHACPGCHRGCHEQSENPLKNGSMCIETYQYNQTTPAEKKSGAAFIPTSLTQKYGINASELSKIKFYLPKLQELGVLGPGKEIDCDLVFNTVSFWEDLCDLIAKREGIGDDIAEGMYRAAQRWGRLNEDLSTGLLDYAYWGQPTHNYDPRLEISWGYGTILGDRDINEHCFTMFFWKNFISIMFGTDIPVGAEEAVTIISQKLKPYDDDLLMLDSNTENLYSEHVAKLVAWHRYYTRFWKESILFCDNRWPDFINTKGPDNKGMTGEGEPKFFNAVTGKTITFENGIETGRKIWNLDNAIWTLQGRHRDMVHFAEFIYQQPYVGEWPMNQYYQPWYEDGQWSYKLVAGRKLDKDKFEEFKTRFYELEGWEKATGWPTRSTLEELDLVFVADELEANGKLGKQEWDLDGDCDVDKDDANILKLRQKDEKAGLKGQQKAEKDEMKAAIGSSGDCNAEMDLDGDCDVDKDDSKLLSLQQKAEKTDLLNRHKAEKAEMKASL